MTHFFNVLFPIINQLEIKSKFFPQKRLHKKRVKKCNVCFKKKLLFPTQKYDLISNIIVQNHKSIKIS